jgi:hypothetical protein
MAIGLIFEVPGVTQEQYDAASQQVDAGGPMEGGWRVIEVWESQDEADRFFRERLQHVLGRVGIPLVEPKVFPVHSLVQT